jgi:hypothetical protein
MAISKLANPVEKVLFHDHEYEIDGRGRNRGSKQNQLNISKLFDRVITMDQED